MNSVLLSLLLTSFLAGSFIPLGSEAYLALLYKQGYEFWPLLLFSSIGNTLGGMSCYLISRFGGRPLIRKYLRTGDQKLNIWEGRLQGRGEWVALFCWLPVVGELIATVLGLSSQKYGRITFYMFLGKLGRYYLLLKLLGAL